VLVTLTGALAAVAAAAFMPGWTAEATGKAVVRLTDVQTTLTRFGPSGAGGGQVARLRLYGSGSATRPIGHAVVTCMSVGLGEQTCSGSYSLPRGTLETSGLLRKRLLYTQAIIGGTGLFDNARGTLTVTATSVMPRREVLLFRLTG
jgi:hypothetical protein